MQQTIRYSLQLHDSYPDEYQDTEEYTDKDSIDNTSLDVATVNTDQDIENYPEVHARPILKPMTPPTTDHQKEYITEDQVISSHTASDSALITNNKKNLHEESLTQKNDNKKHAVPTYDSLNLKYKRNNPPIYPTRSIEMEEHGIVMLYVEINFNGTIRTVQIKQSSGYRRLDKAALDAAKKWEFFPVSLSDNKNSNYVKVLIPVEFNIELIR